LADLRRALARDDELTMHYQPKISVDSGALCGAEALLRWRHPERGLIPPSGFIETAEESGIIGPLTLRMVELALDQQQVWLATGQDVPVAVKRVGAVSTRPDVRRHDSKTTARAG
jgi:EAL domain-containing protein (putative c-di-GMP-specific phosphodiesterase class I)